MKEFFVGLLVLLVMMVLTIVGIFLLPFIVVLGFFLKWLISIALLIFSIWLVGWVTLLAIANSKNKES